MFIYVFAMGSIFFLSLQVKNNDKKFQSIYYAVSTFLGLYGCLIMALMVVNLIDLANTNFGQNLTERDCNIFCLRSLHARATKRKQDSSRHRSYDGSKLCSLHPACAVFF
jgi:hypothetical protein